MLKLPNNAKPVFCKDYKMAISKKFLLGTVCSFLAVAPVAAQMSDTATETEGLVSVVEKQPAVLFKIHDVKPIRNHEGKVTSCEFSATFYNRSENNVNDIVMNLTWKDEAIQKVIQAEKELDQKKMREENYNNNGGQFRLPKSETEKLSSDALNASLKVPDLKAYRQISIKSTIDTDRCFLMIDNPTFKFGSCKVVNAQSTSVTLQRAGSTACDSLFKFVPATDPEYYKEFKKVTFNEEKKAKVQAQKKEQDELKQIYDKTVVNLSRATDIMGQIR